MTDPRRALPSVGALLDHPEVRNLLGEAPRSLVADAARAVVERARRDASAATDQDHLAGAIADEVARRLQSSLRPVFNATGVVLHTNLGRAPLAAAALAAIARTAGCGSNIEYDLDRGERGSRYVHCATLLCELTGAEDALVVNNCAAALVLALNTLADGREAIISRGELIEIGGSFRVPEIMARSGAVLREVGTTNRTHAHDYRAALSSSTAVIVKVHRSNFEVRGFVAEASLSELAPIASNAGVPLLFDFGSGLMLSLEAFGLAGEPSARDGIRGGATLVLMSGDKLLGGPQAGLIIGARDAIEACRRNPLARAVRVDKLTIAALEATLALYRDPERARREIPTLAMLTMPRERVYERSRIVADTLVRSGIACDIVPVDASVGGGAFPTARISSWALSPRGSASVLEQRLRRASTAIVGRVADDRLLLDLRSLPEAHDTEFTDALRNALAGA